MLEEVLPQAVDYARTQILELRVNDERFNAKPPRDKSRPGRYYTNVRLPKEGYGVITVGVVDRRMADSDYGMSDGESSNEGWYSNKDEEDEDSNKWKPVRGSQEGLECLEDDGEDIFHGI